MWIAPFVLILAAIAILPLVAPHFWEKNANKGILALVLGAPVLVLLFAKGPPGAAEVGHTAKDYVSFIVLLGSLFIVSGGILVRGSLRATPVFNVGFLALGALLASFIGTTGASMLLIRPLLRANTGRANIAIVVVFFIFVVSNIGGSLTPLGDPPLFLGYLKGVPFEWTLRLLPHWATTTGIVLTVFFVIDVLAARRHRIAPVIPTAAEPVRIDGAINFLFLGGIVASAFLSGRDAWPWGVQESAMALMALLSLAATSTSVRLDNRFTYGPIIEVAVLFAGIFATMIPALLILHDRAGSLGISKPSHFFWASGMLSSFLDNAPTYLTFLSVAQGLGPATDGGGMLALHDGAVSHTLLTAISCGAVFMGANSYIGNGPNFMVKAVAEESGVKMPSFFGYMGYSTAILIPTFIVLTLVFFA